MSNFRQLLRESLKSKDTEEWIDVYFTRPIGLVFALFWKRLGVHPNTITILSIFLGIAAGVMFAYTDLLHNILGVLFLMFANFCDSTDGQLARLTNTRTLIGRMLDGFSGDVWFFSIYMAICIRLQGTLMPGTDVKWGVWIWVMAAVSGLLCHSPQSSLSDYYRQIHLYFLEGKAGSELNSYRQERKIYESFDKKDHLSRAFYYSYANYCKSQENRTPAFQKFFRELNKRYPNAEDIPQDLREKFLKGSRPLMKYTNLLTFNFRAICLYVTCLLNCPWVYLLIEITFLSCIYIYMHKRHEALCASLTLELK